MSNCRVCNKKVGNGSQTCSKHVKTLQQLIYRGSEPVEPNYHRKQLQEGFAWDEVSMI